jgi:uncharacterized protein
MSNFFAKGTDYFSFFEKGIEISNRAAKVLQKAFAGSEIDEKEIARLREIEHEGDRHVHECASQIANAFITPIDRVDLMNIVARIESVTDSLDDIGNQIFMMHITRKNEVMGQFIELIAEACSELSEMMVAFKQFKRSQSGIHEIAIKVNHIEEEGDALFTRAMRTLFDPAAKLDAMEVIRLQNLYNTLENALDYCEDVADAVEQVIISNT